MKRKKKDSFVLFSFHHSNRRMWCCVCFLFLLLPFGQTNPLPHLSTTPLNSNHRRYERNDPLLSDSWHLVPTAEVPIGNNEIFIHILEMTLHSGHLNLSVAWNNGYIGKG
jgi:hypothetical protein